LAAIRRFAALDVSFAQEPAIEEDDPRWGYQIKLSPRSRQLLPEVKRAAREAVRRILFDNQAATLSDEDLSTRIARTFQDVHLSNDPQKVLVRRQPNHPGRVAVALSLASPHGTDDSVYVYEEHDDSLPLLVMAIESNGYELVTGAPYALSFAISPPDERERYFVIVAYSSPWFASAWSGITYRALEATSEAEAPRELFTAKEPAYLDSDKIAFVTADHNAFELHFLSRWDAFDLLSPRLQVRRYVQIADEFVRAQPVVVEAIDLPEEWLRLPWKEAKRWSKAPSTASLQRWHARLLDPKLRESSAEFSEEVAEATETHTIVKVSCPRCTKLPRGLIFDLVRDGPGYVLTSIAESR
jgi:hypothetical protein